jgi:hypothetical protein
MSFTIPACDMKKIHCANCNSHFANLRNVIQEVEATKHFEHDIKDETERNRIISQVIGCDSVDFHEMHKFEFSVKGSHIFRAKKNRMHVVYAVSGNKMIFLRAIKNYDEYKRFLETMK